LDERHLVLHASVTDPNGRLKHEGCNRLAALDSGDVDPANFDDQRLHCVVDSAFFVRPKQSVVSLLLDQRQYRGFQLFATRTAMRASAESVRTEATNQMSGARHEVNGGEMNKKFFSSVHIILVVLVIIATAGSKLYAIDSNNRYFAYGVGQKTCEDYVKFREKKLDTLEQQHPRYTKDELYEIVDKIVEHWIAGFLTATDLYVADTYNVAGNTTMDEMKVQLEKICRANGNQRFVEAMITLVQQLNPQRVKADPGK
jgi:hypothetical protein